MSFSQSRTANKLHLDRSASGSVNPAWGEVTYLQNISLYIRDDIPDPSGGEVYLTVDDDSPGQIDTSTYLMVQTEPRLNGLNPFLIFDQPAMEINDLVSHFITSQIVPSVAGRGCLIVMSLVQRPPSRKPRPYM